jgi:hypothetical protein
LQKTWKLNNSVLKPGPLKLAFPESLLINSQKVSGRNVVESQLASYFSAIGKTTADTIFPAPSDPDYKSCLGKAFLKSMGIEPVSESKICRIVSSLLGTSSPGPDEILIKDIKFILQAIVSPLTELLQASFGLGILPSSLKSATLIVLFKGTLRSYRSNCRPISLLSVFSKVFEKAMFTRLRRLPDTPVSS